MAGNYHRYFVTIRSGLLTKACLPRSVIKNVARLGDSMMPTLFNQVFAQPALLSKID
jgi:hypothetical protein